MAEIIVNSKNSLLSKIESLTSDIDSDASSIESSASSLSGVQNCEDIDLSTAARTIVSNFNNIFTDFSNVSKTASNYINNLIGFDINDFSAVTSAGATGTPGVSTDTSPGSDNTNTGSGETPVTYTAGEILPGGMAIPMYYQQDYEDVGLGYSSNVAEAGCGFTSCSMVVSYLTGQTITPREFVGDWSQEHFGDDIGMYYTLPQAAADHYGLGTVEETYDIDRVVEALQNGQPVISSQDGGTFDQYGYGHLITLRGVTDDGRILVNDPNINNSEYNTSSFTAEEIDENVGKYFIFEAKK